MIDPKRHASRVYIQDRQPTGHNDHCWLRAPGCVGYHQQNNVTVIADKKLVAIDVASLLPLATFSLGM